MPPLRAFYGMVKPPSRFLFPALLVPLLAPALAPSSAIAGDPASSTTSVVSAPPVAKISQDPTELVRLFVGTDARPVLAHLDGVVQATAKRLAANPGGAKPEAIAAALRREIAANLSDKAALKSFPLSAKEVERTVIDYEAYKLEAFVGSGVFPKRYFGYVDEKWDTAPYEKRLKKTVHEAVAIANGYEARKRSPLRFTDAEIAATFLAEGGAILLREEQAHLDDIHPVFGVGLDDVGSGVAQYADLVALLDAHFRTGVGQVVHADGGQYKGATLTRNFTFDEGLLGTTLMWVFEKERAERKLRSSQKKELSAMSSDDQFIVGSLMYNSGLVFDPDRVEKIRTFTSGEYLAGISKKAAQTKGELPVGAPKDSLAAFLAHGYPAQETSWNAVYHVLQRWGAYHSLRTQTDVFDDEGMFRQ